jgi:hypothetical protein
MLGRAVCQTTRRQQNELLWTFSGHDRLLKDAALTNGNPLIFE